MKRRKAEEPQPERVEDISARTWKKIRRIRRSNFIFMALDNVRACLASCAIIFLMICFRRWRGGLEVPLWMPAVFVGSFAATVLMHFHLKPVQEYRELSANELAGFLEPVYLRAVRALFGESAHYRGETEHIRDWAPYFFNLDEASKDNDNSTVISGPETLRRHWVDAARGACTLSLGDVLVLSATRLTKHGKEQHRMLNGIYGELRFSKPFPWSLEAQGSGVPLGREWVFPESADAHFPSGKWVPGGVSLSGELGELLRECRVKRLIVHPDGRIEFTIPKGKLLKPGFRDLDDDFDAFRENGQKLLALLDALIAFHAEHAAAPDAVPAFTAEKKATDSREKKAAAAQTAPSGFAPLRQILRIVASLLLGLAVYGFALMFTTARNDTFFHDRVSIFELIGMLALALLIGILIIGSKQREAEQMRSRTGAAEPDKAARNKGWRPAAAGFLGTLALLSLIAVIAVSIPGVTEQMLLCAIPAVLAAATWLLASAGRR